MEPVDEVEQRNQQAIGFFKNNSKYIFVIILLALVILGIYLRVQPLTDHGGRPGLWDATLNDGQGDFTLGPDLDPFLFLRYAREMVDGTFNSTYDKMRYSPIGFDTSRELLMVSYAIVGTYYLTNLFGDYSINFAGAFMPVLAFALTIIAFFFFVRELFRRKNDDFSKLKANIVASISSLFFIVIPSFLPRTVAGIPEKESLAFLFMFMAFYFFLRAWKSEGWIKSSLLAILAAISTAFMGLTWGGVTFVYITIGLAVLIAFFMNKTGKRETLIYAIWLILAFVLNFTLTSRFDSLQNYILYIVLGINYAGIATLSLAILITHQVLWNTKIKNLSIWNRINLPKNIISIIIASILGISFILIINPAFMLERVTGLYHTLIKPVTGRWSTTVAENRQPYFNEWMGSFGQTFFWLFFAGSISLFYKAFNGFNSKKRIILTSAYCLFLFGLVFSRIAPHPATLDGEGIISLILYFGSALFLVGLIVHYYIQDYKREENKFRAIEFEYIFLLSLLVLCLFTARSAVRLIMVLVPVATIFLGFMIGELFELISKKDGANSNRKFYLTIIAVIVVCLSIYAAFTFYQEIKPMAYNYVPYYYTLQWQQAMSWVRESTPIDSVFIFWWDYGWWMHSIGNRASVTDGGNAIVWWNYLVGRFMLTGNNQNDALDLAYAHNVSYLLIDSSDVGKYGAYSQIGSDANMDRFSQGPVTFITGMNQLRETKEGIARSYNSPSGQGYNLMPIEEDFSYNGTTYFTQKTALLGIEMEYVPANDTYKQPLAIFVTNIGQSAVPMRYAYHNGIFQDFGSGINATAYPIQRLYDMGQSGLQVDDTGALIYISPRVTKTLFAQVYLLDDPMKNFQAFSLAHTEPDYILNSISAQGLKLGDWVFFNQLLGPIKIYKINYTGNEVPMKDSMLTEVPDYITWKF